MEEVTTNEVVVVVLVVAVVMVVTLGSESCRSDVFLICCFSSASVLNALTAIGTSCRRWLERCAVTMISVSARSDASCA